MRTFRNLGATQEIRRSGCPSWAATKAGGGHAPLLAFDPSLAGLGPKPGAEEASATWLVAK